ncbi:MAG: helix-turn-helix domain-containing protein [Alphaproteobacteria bacterium]|nr:helix-turn-helix domain-containing protein [Alphaproteobacteria bacterium]
MTTKFRPADARRAIRALANERRLAILGWLKEPAAHFPPPAEGHCAADGVCGAAIADKLAVSAPTASEHLKILAEAGLLRSRRVRQWTFYRRDEKAIRKLKRAIAKAF